MSTRSLIGIKRDGNITSIYCHFDGYLEGVGETLVNHYDTEEKIDALLEHGDMSCLGEDIKSCEFYKDRGEDDVDAQTLYEKDNREGDSVENRYYISGQHCWADYVYLFKDGKWYYAFECVDNEKMKGLTISFTKETKESPILYLPPVWKLVTDGIAEIELKRKQKQNNG